MARKVSDHLPLLAAVGVVAVLATAVAIKKQRAADSRWPIDKAYSITSEYVAHLWEEHDGIHWEVVKRDPLLGTLKKVVGTQIGFGVAPNEKLARKAAQTAYETHVAAAAAAA
jgi:hypothetical protein